MQRNLTLFIASLVLVPPFVLSGNSISTTTVEPAGKRNTAAVFEASKESIHLAKQAFETVYFEVLEFSDPAAEKHTHHVTSCGGHAGMAQPAHKYVVMVKDSTIFIESEIVCWTTNCGGGCYHVYREEVLEEREDTPIVEAFEPWDVLVYPNPVRYEATLQITGFDDTPYQFEMYDLSGKRVMHRQKEINASMQFNRGSLAPGIYIYRIISEDELNVHTGKLVFQ